MAPTIKQPPQSKLDEETVIASLIVDDEQWPEVAAHLVMSDFMFDSCRFCFASMVELKKRGEHINEVTLPAEMERAQTYEQAGGAAFMARIGEETPDTRHAADAAREVKRLSLNRHLISMGGKITQLGYANMANPTTKLAEAQAAMLELSSRFNPAAVLTPQERARRMSDRYLAMNESYECVLDWPFEKLTEASSGIYPGEYWVIAGETGTGKTTLINRLAVHWSPLHPVLIANTEMTWEHMGDRQVAEMTGKPIREIRQGNYKDGLSDAIQDACGVVGQQAIYHLPLGELAGGVEGIRQQAKQIQSAHGLGCIIVDYLQEVKINMGPRASVYEKTTAVSSAMRAMARELAVPVIAVSSLNRGAVGRAGASKLPQLSDLRNSGEIEYQADGVIMMHRPFNYTKKPEDEFIVVLSLAKNRAEGKIGQIELVWSEKDRLHRQSVMN